MPLTVSFEVSGDRGDANVKMPDECPDFSLTKSTRLDGALVQYCLEFASDAAIGVGSGIIANYIYARYIGPNMQSKVGGTMPGLGTPPPQVTVEGVTRVSGPVSTSDDLAQLMKKAEGGGHSGNG